MKTRLIAAAALLLFAGGGLAMYGEPRIDPMPPVGLYGFFATVGTVASAGDKIEVSIVAVITRDNPQIQIDLKDKAMMGAKAKLSPSELPAIADALTEASEAVFGRRSFSAVIGSTTIATVSTGGGTSAVVLKIKREGFTLSSDTMRLDADNAESLSRLIRRTARIIAWLEPRLPAMHPDSELPLTIGQEHPE